MDLSPTVTKFLHFSAALLAAFAAFCSTTIAVDSAAATRNHSSKTTGSASSDALQTWIAENAVAVRSIDALDEDFSDLEPLIDAIGSDRIVCS